MAIKRFIVSPENQFQSKKSSISSFPESNDSTCNASSPSRIRKTKVSPDPKEFSEIRNASLTNAPNLWPLVSLMTMRAGLKSKSKAF
jgi:hypothetical protein